MSDFYSRQEVPMWRIVAYGILATAGVAAVGYFANQPRLYYLAPFPGVVIAGLGLLASKARAGGNAVRIARPQKQSRFNYWAITGGVCLVIWSVVAICNGHITVGRRHPHTYSLAQDPHGFWAMIAINLVFVAIFFFYGFTGRR